MAQSSSSDRIVGAAGLAVILAVAANTLDSNVRAKLDRAITAVASGTALLDVKLEDGSLLPLNNPSESDKARLAKVIKDGEYNLSYSNELPVYPYSHILVRDAAGNEICTIRLEARTLGKLVSHKEIDPTVAADAKSIEDLSAICGISSEEVQAIQVSGVQQLDHYASQMATSSAAPQLGVTNVTLGSALIAGASIGQTP